MSKIKSFMSDFGAFWKSYLKHVSAFFYKIFIFLSDDRPSKNTKNVFYLI